MSIYFAYGANTNINSMARRCPGARAIAPALLRGWKLVFRGVADLIERKDAEVFGGLWEISPENEKALDRFEGFPDLYVKRYVRISLKGRERWCMFYVMRDRDWHSPPSPGYEATLREGYREFGLPLVQLEDAIRHAERAARKRWHRKPGLSLLDAKRALDLWGEDENEKKNLDRSSGED